jgi:hypothetical protein
MTSVPVVTFMPGDGSAAIELDGELFKRAERALDEEQRRQARDPEEAQAQPGPEEKPARIVVGQLGARASGWFS